LKQQQGLETHRRRHREPPVTRPDPFEPPSYPRPVPTSFTRRRPREPPSISQLDHRNSHNLPHQHRRLPPPRKNQSQSRRARCAGFLGQTPQFKSAIFMDSSTILKL
ncbi:unnamed protein product, partial [Prunus brigantina]